MHWPNLWFLPRAFLLHGGHGGGELLAFPAPSTHSRAMLSQTSGATCAARMPVHVRSRSRY